MDTQQAALFIELLTCAGWLDDADELIADMLDDPNITQEEVQAKCELIDRTINEANALLPKKERVKLHRTTVEQFREQVG